MKKGRNQTLEWVKIIAACFVVLIHITVPGTLGKALDCLGRFAVPLFFEVSGYFSYETDSKTLGRRLRRILRLLLLSNGIYCLWTFWQSCMMGGGTALDFLRSRFSPARLAVFLLTGESPFECHLWFLSALALCYGILLVYTRWFEGRPIHYQPLYSAGFALWVAFVCMDTFSKLQNLELSFYVYRNGLFFGVPMACMGLFLREHQERIMTAFSWNWKRSGCLILIGAALSLLERVGLGRQTEMPIGMLLTVPALLLLCVRYPTLPLIGRPLAPLTPWLGSVSTTIYITHLLFYRVLAAYQMQVPLFDRMISSKIVPVFMWPILLALLLSGPVCLVQAGLHALTARRRNRRHAEGQTPEG